MAPEDGLRAKALGIWERTRAEDFNGSDPYDGLNSRLLGPLTRRSRLLGRCLTQVVKGSPLNLRLLLGVPAGSNPKGLALFLSGLTDLPGIDDSGESIKYLTERLLSSASRPDGSPAFSSDRSPLAGIEERLAIEGCGGPIGWGYHFPWQGRAFRFPAWFPSVVCTSFVVDALNDAGSPAAEAVTSAAAELVSGSLNRFEDPSGTCFSYSPMDSTRVYNASLFGAKILARAAGSSLSDGSALLARKAVSFVLSRQNEDGSWDYGDGEQWKWIDGLHTGFVLESLGSISGFLDADEWDGSIEAGLEYYRTKLFDDDWTARYYPGDRYPLDPHTFAQGALTFQVLSRFSHCPPPEAAGAILRKGVELLWDDRRNGFVFRQGRWVRNRTVHMRWSQAWMFRAICRYLSSGEGE